MWLHIDGKTTFIDFYRLAGFGTRMVKVDNKDFKGWNYFISQRTKIPVFRYNDGSKIR